MFVNISGYKPEKRCRGMGVKELTRHDGTMNNEFGGHVPDFVGPWIPRHCIPAVIDSEALESAAVNDYHATACRQIATYRWAL